MSAFLNPWILLGAVLWTAFVGAMGYKHGHDTATDAALVREAVATQAAQDEQGRLNAERLATQRAMVRQMDNQHENYYREANDAKAKTDRVIADMRRRNAGLRIPASCPDRDPAGAGNTGLAAGSGREGYAELSPDDSGEILRALQRGDTAIRKHGAVVDRYNALADACRAAGS